MTKKKKKVQKSAKKGQDIIDLILEDHKPLKKLIKIMKNSDKTLSERRKAFAEFAPLLTTHAKPEEQVLYVEMKKAKDLRQEGLEGDVEHGLAEQMLDEAKVTKDADLWSARVKVLAELVEHHIEEEEEELLPDFKKNSEKEQRILMGEMFLAAKENTLDDGNERVPMRPVKDKNSIISIGMN